MFRVRLTIIWLFFRASFGALKHAHTRTQIYLSLYSYLAKYFVVINALSGNNNNKILSLPLKLNSRCLFSLCSFSSSTRLVYANDFPFSTLYQLICICSDDTCDIACPSTPAPSPLIPFITFGWWTTERWRDGEFSRVNGLKPTCGLSASLLGSKFAFDLKFRLNVWEVRVHVDLSSLIGCMWSIFK